MQLLNTFSDHRPDLVVLNAALHGLAGRWRTLLELWRGARSRWSLRPDVVSYCAAVAAVRGEDAQVRRLCSEMQHDRITPDLAMDVAIAESLAAPPQLLGALSETICTAFGSDCSDLGLRQNDLGQWQDAARVLPAHGLAKPGTSAGVWPATSTPDTAAGRDRVLCRAWASARAASSAARAARAACAGSGGAAELPARAAAIGAGAAVGIGAAAATAPRYHQVSSENSYTQSQARKKGFQYIGLLERQELLDYIEHGIRSGERIVPEVLEGSKRPKTERSGETPMAPHKRKFEEISDSFEISYSEYCLQARPLHDLTSTVRTVGKTLPMAVATLKIAQQELRSLGAGGGFYFRERDRFIEMPSHVDKWPVTVLDLVPLNLQHRYAQVRDIFWNEVERFIASARAKHFNFKDARHPQVRRSGHGTCVPGAPPMVVRLSSWVSTPRSLARDEPVCVAGPQVSNWSPPEMGMATWPAPAASIRSPRNTVSTPREESPVRHPTDPAERAALRAKLRILPSRPEAEVPNRSVSPRSRKGGRPTVQRMQSPRSALRRSASSSGYSGVPSSYSASVPASQPQDTSQSVTAPASVLERELGAIQRKAAEREDPPARAGGGERRGERGGGWRGHDFRGRPRKSRGLTSHSWLEVRLLDDRRLRMEIYADRGYTEQCFDPRAVSAPGAGTAGLRFFDPDSTIYDGRCAGETELRRALTAETLREAGRCGRVRWAG
eukprot:g17405.t1